MCDSLVDFRKGRMWFFGFILSLLKISCNAKTKSFSGNTVKAFSSVRFSRNALMKTRLLWAKSFFCNANSVYVYVRARVINIVDGRWLHVNFTGFVPKITFCRRLGHFFADCCCGEQVFVVWPVLMYRAVFWGWLAVKIPDNAIKKSAPFWDVIRH